MKRRTRDEATHRRATTGSQPTTPDRPSLLVIEGFKRNPEPTIASRPRLRQLWKVALATALLLALGLIGSLSRGSEPTPDVDTVAAVERASDRTPAPLGRTERITAAPAVIVRSQSFEEQRSAVEVIEVVEVVEAPRPTSTSTATTTTEASAVPGVIGLPKDSAVAVLRAAGYSPVITTRATSEPAEVGIVLSQSGDGAIVVGVVE